MRLPAKNEIFERKKKLSLQLWETIILNSSPEFSFVYAICLWYEAIVLINSCLTFLKLAQ